jgi:hypothetical protein
MPMFSPVGNRESIRPWQGREHGHVRLGYRFMFLTRHVTKIAASEWFRNRNVTALILTVRDRRRPTNILEVLI